MTPSEKSMLRRRDVLREFMSQHVELWRDESPALVVGSRVYDGRADRRTLYRDAVGVDIVDGPGVDIVHNMERAPLPDSWERYGVVDCVSVLEHSRAPWALAAEIERSMRIGGKLVLSVPWVWRFHGYPDDYWRFTPAGVRALFPRISWDAMALSSCGELHKRLDVVPVVEHRDFPHFARTEVLAIGTRV